MSQTLSVNGKLHQIDVDGRMPLLWVLREKLNLTGTKFGCGVAQCGACSVLVNGQRVYSCVSPVSSIGDGAVTTIEGLDEIGGAPIKKAWEEVAVPQCGYCQPGMMMNAAALLLSDRGRPDRSKIRQHMDNICRCGTYPRVIRAIEQAADDIDGKDGL